MLDGDQLIQIVGFGLFGHWPSAAFWIRWRKRSAVERMPNLTRAWSSLARSAVVRRKVKSLGLSIADR